ncbi:MAG: tetraacyldisaccharide 4'-kinase [Planctomycetota bacterium]|nr:MAG: tetraacyldisaccharide 4'-kinase [Planctomycetota bacterium]
MPLFPDAESFKRLADGSLHGPGASLLRLSFALASAPYALAMTVRNAAYDARWLAISSGTVPIVSVGNLTLGGTGKTPLVAWLARAFCRQGLRPAIVSRGYGARRGQASDEAAELGILLPDVPHSANPDRVAAARTAVAGGAEVIVLDDGFQHRRLARDIDIVAVDATDPFGCGYIFPRGLLREPLAGLARADAVVLTRAGLVEPARRREIRDLLNKACCGKLPPIWIEASHRPTTMRTASGGYGSLENIRGQRVAAFAGIGNPAAFRAMLETLGARIVVFHPFPDHHIYSSGDMASLARLASDARADIVVTTLKDLVKVQTDSLGDIPLAAIEISLEILSDASVLDALLATIPRQEKR